MRRAWQRAGRPQVPVPSGERVLAWAEVPGGVVAGGRDALYVVPVPPAKGGEPALRAARIPWEQVEAADWDPGTAVLRVVEVGSWGQPRPEHRFAVQRPGRLPELVRERVTASVVLQRAVPVDGGRWLRVIGRRAPAGDRPIRWIYEYDEGVDPDDPAVAAAAAAALADAQDEVGLR